MDLFRGFFLSAAMGGIAFAGFPSTAAGEMIRPSPPFVNEIEVACKIVDGHRYTVRVQTQREGLEFRNLQFNFKNVQVGTAALITLSPQASSVPATATIVGYLPYYQLQNQMFDIPAGVYDLTITLSGQSQLGEFVFRNIVVPATVGTSGRGAGCKFQ